MPQRGWVGWVVLKCDLEWRCLSLTWGGWCLSLALERAVLGMADAEGCGSAQLSRAVPERSLGGRAAPELGSRTALSGLGGAHLGRLGLRCALQRGWARSFGLRCWGGR